MIRFVVDEFGARSVLFGDDAANLLPRPENTHPAGRAFSRNHRNTAALVARQIDPSLALDRQQFRIFPCRQPAYQGSSDPSPAMAGNEDRFAIQLNTKG